MNNLLVTTHAPIAETKPAVAKQISRPLVMVVDDHADTREMLKFAIETRGCRVVEASDGEEAVQLAQRLQPNLILMDTGLPCVDGYVATQRIRKLESTRKVTIIFLSGYAPPQARKRALAAGGDDYFLKPVSLEELERALEKYLRITG